jgi:pyridoxamine 5'-phosphate oxidase family protein
MNPFTEAERAYLEDGHKLARVATVGPDGTPHVVPVGWWVDPILGVVEVRGHDLAGTKKFRDVARSGRAAIVIDDLASTDPWRPRGIEVRGRAQALDEDRAVIRIHPERIVSWGIESGELGKRHARSVGRRDKTEMRDTRAA